MFENMIEQLTDKMFRSMANMEKFKALPMVDGWTWLEIGRIGNRARLGLPLVEPEGSTRGFPTLKNLVFVPAQLATQPTYKSTEINTKVILGKNAKKPLEISTPIMLTGMAYGASVAKKVKIAWGQAAAKVDTACNSGETGFVPEEREAAGKYIIQYNKARFNNTDEQLKQCDMIEFRVGQGASLGMGWTIPSEGMTNELRDFLGIDRDRDANMPDFWPDIKDTADLKKEVNRIRDLTGVPIAVKIGAGNVEGDLQVALEAGFDVVVLDGSQGSTAGSEEILINNFGIPLVYALPRAVKYLEGKSVRDKIDIVASGGIHNSGDVLKALALGANAVYMGYAAVVAMTYSQWSKMDVGSTPPEMALYDGTQTEKLDIEKAAMELANFLNANTEELKLGTRALGKTDVTKVNKNDLVALQREISEITGVKLAF